MSEETFNEQIKVTVGTQTIFIYEIGGVEHLSMINVIKYVADWRREKAESFIICNMGELCVELGKGLTQAWAMNITYWEAFKEKLATIKINASRLQELEDMIRMRTMPQKSCARPEPLFEQKPVNNTRPLIENDSLPPASSGSVMPKVKPAKEPKLGAREKKLILGEQQELDAVQEARLLLGIADLYAIKYKHAHNLRDITLFVDGDNTVHGVSTHDVVAALNPYELATALLGDCRDVCMGKESRLVHIDKLADVCDAIARSSKKKGLTVSRGKIVAGWTSNVYRLSKYSPGFEKKNLEELTTVFKAVAASLEGGGEIQKDELVKLLNNTARKINQFVKAIV